MVSAGHSGKAVFRTAGRLRCIRRSLVALATALSPALALALDPAALPTGGTVAAGAATIHQAGAALNVQQQSHRAILNWNTFNIGAKAAVNFQQPASTSVVLNRVASGGGVSEIYGNLTANGQVFLINPAGTLFARGAQVNVGGLIASSLDITNENFLNGIHRFAGNGAAGSILNQGTLTAAEGGYIALLAPQIRNEGVVAARMGTVAFGAGEAVRLDMSGAGLVEMQVEKTAVDALIANRALVQADGGVVLMGTRAAGQLAAGVINNTGEIHAARVTERDGIIRLEAGDVTNSGTIAANGAVGGRVTLESEKATINSGSISARGSEGKGGDARLLGNKVGLFGTGSVDVSGEAGGGRVLVGGNYQGKGPERNASRTVVDPGARINASATGTGDGGTVIVWSNDLTRFSGSIEAKGGPGGGNGGFVETSGKDVLQAFGTVDASAPKGKGGVWLLDPNNITISGGTDANTTGSFESTDDGAIVNNVTLGNALTNGTTVDVTTQSSGTNSEFGDISVEASVTANLTTGQTATLNLNAQRNIDFTAGGNLNGGTGILNVNLNAGTDVGFTNMPGTMPSAITMTMGASISTGGGNLTATANANGITLAGINTGAGTLTVTSNGGAISQASPITVGGTSTFNAGMNTIMLTNALNDFGGAVSLSTSSANGVQITDANSLSLGTLSIGGSLGVTSAGALNLGGGSIGGSLVASTSGSGAMTQTSGLTVSGTSTISASGNTIALADASNDFVGSVTATGSNIQLKDANALSAALTASGTGTLTAAGNLTASGSTSGALTTTTTGSGTTTLSALTVSSASITSAGAITISGVLDAGSGAVNLTSSGGAISESGSGKVSTTGVLNTSSASGQTLTGANTVSTFNATNSSGNLSFTNTASSLSISGINNTGTGNVTVNNTGVMSITGTVNAIGAGSNVSLTSSGQMSESGSGVVNAAGTLTTSSVGGLSLNGANTVGGFNATNTTSGNIAFTNTANSFNSAPTVAGITTLAVGSITQSGGGGITIANTGNLSTSGLVSSSGGSISLTSTNGSQTIGGSGLNAGAGGITLNATGAASDITLNSFLTMGSFTANAGRDLVRNAGFATSTGGFSATAGRDIRILAAGTTAGLTASTMTLFAGGELKIQGGTGTGALAYAYSNGTGASQTVSANSISILGGSVGNGNYAGIFGRGPQSVTAPAGITLKGGPSGGVSGSGNFAEISTTGNQTITVGAGGLTALGGGGGATNTDNFARIYQYDAASTQTINVNHGGSIVLTGGSSGLSGVGGVGHGSRAAIDTTGVSQLISFAAGGAINLTGGTVGSRAFALITSENGTQTITGAPSITLTGGASGGIDGEGNYAEIFAKTGQTISASSVLLTGGAAGIGNGAGIVSDAFQTLTSGGMTLNAGAGGTRNAAFVQARTQNITVHGDLSLNGGGSASSATNGGGAGLGGLGAPNASPTNLVLTVDGNLTMAGGASGAAIGSGFIGGQATDMTINVGGNVTLNPGSAGVRIGTPAANIAGGNISITAGGAIALNDTATVGSSIRTLGNVTLSAASISEGTNGKSLIAANVLTSTSLAGATSFNTIAVSSLNATANGSLNLGQGVINGALVANSSGNPVTQTGPLFVAGTASITAGAAPITLTAANDFQGAVTLSNTGLHGSQISDANTITFTNMVLGGGLTVNAPTIIAHDTTTTGNQLWNGSVTFNSTETTNGGSFTVAGTTTVGGGLTVNAGSGNVTFQGAVTGSKPLVVNSTGVTTFASTVSPTVSVTVVGGASTASTTTKAATQTASSVVASTTTISTDAGTGSQGSSSYSSSSSSTTSTGAAAATVAAAAGPAPAPLTAASSSDAGTTRLTASSGVSKETIRQIDQQIAQARTQMFSPALTQLASDPSIADVPECGSGGQGVCVKQGKPKKAATITADTEPVIKRRVAVLFGNDRYLAPIPGLQTPIRDVEEIGKVLKEQLGYETRVIKNASKEAIVNELNNLVTEVDEEDSVFVYYAGHGYQAEKGGGGYWIPVDANNSDASSWISNSAISKFLANMASRQVMLVSDSCYSGTLAQEQKVSATETTVFDRKEILRKRSVLVMSSGGNEPVSDGGHDNHSLFAYHFLRNLKSIDADLVGSDIHNRVHAAVTKEYPQDPQYGAVVSAGHAEGGEYLIQKR